MVNLDSSAGLDVSPIQKIEEPVKIYKFKERLMTILARTPVNTTLGKQIKIQLERNTRLTELREKIKKVTDENEKLNLFTEFHRDEFTRHLVMVKRHARPKRLVKTKADMLKCVSNGSKKGLLITQNDDSEEAN